MGNAPVARVPRVAVNPLEENVVLNNRVATQLVTEQERIENAIERLNTPAAKKAEKAKKAAEREVSDIARRVGVIRNTGSSGETSVLMDSKALRQIQANRSKELAPLLQMDKTRPGGLYIVGENYVNANGKVLGSVREVAEAIEEEESQPTPPARPVSPPPGPTGATGATGETGATGSTGSTGENE